jgi:Mn2+/Fe2+ NRAMP family transporter
MSKIFEIALGIVTSVGGFLDIGSIATAAQAGALFDYRLVWAVLLGGACVAVLVEQAGRLAAVSGHTVVGAIRERFGYPYFAVLLLLVGAVTVLVLSAEIGGACVAIELTTGVRFTWWIAPVALTLWALLWFGNFTVIEQGTSLLGLVTVCFVVAAWILRPPLADVARGVLPTLPGHDLARYGFLVVSILGASISPYLMFFYSSGAIEDGWTTDDLGVNRATATLGMGFGTLISVAVLIVAARVYAPRGVPVEHSADLGWMLDDAFGTWGRWLVAASVGIACLGAALEITLSLAYMLAQGFGWAWSKNLRPVADARFTVAYTAIVLAGATLVATGIDPLQITMLSMALTAATLPLGVVPFLFLLNDPYYVREHGNGRISNVVIIAIVALTALIAVVTIPFQIAGGG